MADLQNLIYGEYRNNIKPENRFPYDLLNQLQARRPEREVFVQIELDADGHAIIPFEFSDPSDRKFIAVALAHNPTPDIINATDTDWHENRKAVFGANLTVQELCLEYIQQKFKP